MRNLIICFPAQGLNPAKPQSLRHGPGPKRVVRPASHEWPGRLGALDDRLRRGPSGWRHRLALIEAAELSWFVGDRVSPDRLALWIALRLSGAQEDSGALSRVGWAVRRLTGGPGPEAGLADFLDRRDPENIADDAERFTDRADGWLALMGAADICTLSPGLVWAFTFGAWQVSVSMVTGWRLRSRQAGLLQQKGRVQFSHR